MEWRKWVYERLAASPAVTELIPPNKIFSSGSINGKKSGLFIVIRMMPSAVALKHGVAHRQNADVWVHDEPGGYSAIDQALRATRSALVGPVVSPGGIACEWQGDSQDLSDDGLGTVTKYSSFVLIGSDI